MVRPVLLKLRAVGVGLALDHTGTPHVRLDLLAALPFTRLILDPSFFGGERRQEALVDTVIRFVQDTGIEYTVASEELFSGRYESALQISPRIDCRPDV